MDIILTPVRHDTPMSLERHGDVLTVNGEDFDFSAIPAGATLPHDAIDSEWFSGDVDRDADGKLTVRLLLPPVPPGTADLAARSWSRSKWHLQQTTNAARVPPPRKTPLLKKSLSNTEEICV